MSVRQMKPNIRDDCGSCWDHGGAGPTVYDLPVPLELREEWRRLATRRHFLGAMGKTLGWASLCTLFGGALTPRAARAASESPTISPGHYVPDFAPRAKRAIYLFMSVAPPQMALWDYKPGLAALYDKDLPHSFRGTQPLTGIPTRQPPFPSPHRHYH